MERCEGRDGIHQHLTWLGTVGPWEPWHPVLYREGRTRAQKQEKGVPVKGLKEPQLTWVDPGAAPRAAGKTQGERALRRGLKGYGAVPRRNRGLWLACQSWQMVLHPDEKAGEYACTRSSSIAVKLSANAIHTLASLSVYVCMFPLSSFMPGKKKTKKQNHIPGHECTHKSHETRVSYRDVTGPFPPTPRPSLFFYWDKYEEGIKT